MPHIDDGTLHALMDGALRAHEPERADAVEAHVDACADCRARLEHAAALRDQASDVLAALDAGLAADAAAPAPDFGEVLVRAAAGSRDDAAAEPGDPDSPTPGAGGTSGRAGTARLRRQLGWTRGLAWAATIVVALGAGYIVRDLAGPDGVVPRAPSAAEPASAPDAAEGAVQPVDIDRESTEAIPARMQDAESAGEAPEEPAVETRPAAPRPSAAGDPEAATEPVVPSEEPIPVTLGIEVSRDEAAEAAGPEPAPLQELGGISNLSGAGADAAKAAEPDASRRAVQPTVVAPAVLAESALRDAGGGVASTARAAIPGCYQLELGEWSPARGEGEAPYQTPPAVFEITDSVGPPAGSVEGRGLAAVFEESRPLLRPLLEPANDRMGGYPRAYWAPVPPDSVRLVWSNGFVGVLLDLAVRGDTLEGRAVGSSDAVVEGRPAPTAPARAIRVPCQEPAG